LNLESKKGVFRTAFWHDFCVSNVETFAG
jgi:hypothetical protein